MDSCTICLETLTEGARGVALLECNHKFHAKCVRASVKADSRCPNCRTAIVAYVVGSRTVSVAKKVANNEGSIAGIDYEVEMVVGLRISDDSEIEYKVVWQNKDDSTDGERVAWLPVENFMGTGVNGGALGPKIVEFHNRFNIPLPNLDGYNPAFLLEHEIPLESEDGKRFSCPYNRCDYSSDKKMNVVYHIRNKHVRGIPFTCPCHTHKTFSKKENLKRHLNQVAANQAEPGQAVAWL